MSVVVRASPKLGVLHRDRNLHIKSDRANYHHLQTVGSNLYELGWQASLYRN